MGRKLLVTIWRQSDCIDVLSKATPMHLLDERRGILHVRRHLAASLRFKGIPNFREIRIAMLR